MESAGKGGPSSSSSASSSFPFGLHILVVDDDPTCLMVVEKMLRKCRYEVTTCEHATVALSLLRERRVRYDVVLTDVHMPDMDGFKLLEIVGLEMDLPVVMMSADCDVNVARRGLEHGACYYLMKPISMDEIKNIWQHLIRKKKADGKETGQGSDGKDIEHTGSVEEDDSEKKALEDTECASSINEGSPRKQSKRKKEAKGKSEEGTDDDEEHATQKKPRVIWHSGLHSQFLTAVNHIGIDRAVPKKILELMDVPGLTRENVASHLQKYRLFLRRLNDAQQTQRSLSNAFPGKSKFGLSPPHIMIDYPGQTSYPKFSDPVLPYNSFGLQRGAVANMQNQNASMPLTSINPMTLLNQTSQINNSLATLGIGPSTLNGPTNMQPQILPVSSLSPKSSPGQQSDPKLGFGVVPEHRKTCPLSVMDTLSMTHQRIQANPSPGSCPLDSFVAMNVQNGSSFANMGNAGSINKFKQPPLFNQISNYSGLHLTSSGGLYGMTQTGPLGQVSSNINSGYNLLSEMTKGKMVLDMDPKDSHLLPEFNMPDFNSDPFIKFTSPNPFPTSFPSVNQEPNDLLVGNSSKGGEGETLEDMFKSSRIGNSSNAQHFDVPYLDEMVFKQQKDGTDPMESDFDISTFQIDGSDHTKGAPM